MLISEGTEINRTGPHIEGQRTQFLFSRVISGQTLAIDELTRGFRSSENLVCDRPVRGTNLLIERSRVFATLFCVCVCVCVEKSFSHLKITIGRRDHFPLILHISVHSIRRDSVGISTSVPF